MSRVLDRTLPLPELAQAWGWSPGKLYRLVGAQAIPHLKIRGRIYFELSAVDAWKAAHRRGGQTPDLPTATRTRADECRALGIEPDHAFS